ncbi:MAG: hypothetical protein ACYDIC_00755 [Desulfobaccales bacterium]
MNSAIKSIICLSLIVSLIHFFAGCADISKELKGTARPDSGTAEQISPTKTFIASYDKTWKAVTDVLDNNDIMYEGDSSKGKIVTENKDIQKISGWRGLFAGSNYKAKQFIDVKKVSDTETSVTHKARFTKEFQTIFTTTDKDYPETENILRKAFFEELDKRLSSRSATQIDKKQSSEIKEQPAKPTQPTSKVQSQGEAKEADPSPPTIATVRKAKKEQGLDGYIFQDRNSKKFFLEDSDGNTYKFTGGQWIKMK